MRTEIPSGIFPGILWNISFEIAGEISLAIVIEVFPKTSSRTSLESSSRISQETPPKVSPRTLSGVPFEIHPAICGISRSFISYLLWEFLMWFPLKWFQWFLLIFFSRDSCRHSIRGSSRSSSRNIFLVFSQEILQRFLQGFLPVKDPTFKLSGISLGVPSESQIEGSLVIHYTVSKSRLWSNFHVGTSYFYSKMTYIWAIYS